MFASVHVITELRCSPHVYLSFPNMEPSKMMILDNFNFFKHGPQNLEFLQ